MKNAINFNLRGISPKVMVALKKEAEKQNTSVNLLIIKLVEKGMGYSHEIERPVYHDLDKLAGTWTAKDARDFDKAIKDFEKIDKDIWK
jgi:hypothetical protein